MFSTLKSLLRPPEQKASRTARVIQLETGGRARWTPRDYAALAREGYVKNAIVHRSVRLVAESAASLTLLIYDGEAELARHPLTDLLARPNPRQDGAALAEALYASLLLAGNAYLEAVAVDGGVRELYALRADRMRLVPGPDGWPEAYEYTAGSRTVRFDQTGPLPPILHLTFHHPLDDHYGLSPLEAAAYAVEGGDGNLRYKLSKESAAKTLSLLLQDNFSGRAELGLTGDDDLHVKVSPDGSAWFEAMIADRASGAVRFPSFVSLPLAPQGRLTLATGTPVMTSDQAGKTTVYYTPYFGQYVPIYDGARFIATDTGGELSQATTDSTKSPSAAAANSNYDVFVWNDAGTIRATRGPAWTSDTARGTGAGTTELQRVSGIWTNKNAITNGPAANRGTYVGTIRSNASSQIDWKLGSSASGGGAATFGVWNYYNRRSVRAWVQDSTSTYAYSSATTRAVNNSAGNRVNFVSGMAEDAPYANYKATMILPAAIGGYGVVGHALDSTTAVTHRCGTTNPTTQGSIYFIAQSPGRYDPQIGYHYISANEVGDGTNNYTNTGNAAYVGLEVAVWA
jgi:Phage portal protein